jgi:hypothetical protein
MIRMKTPKSAPRPLVERTSGATPESEGMRFVWLASQNNPYSLSKSFTGAMNALNHILFWAKVKGFDAVVSMHERRFLSRERRRGR